VSGWVWERFGYPEFLLADADELIDGQDDRHLGLTWGELTGDGAMRTFRGAKLRLIDVPADVVAEAMRPGRRLVARVRLTDANGNPVCARLRSSHLTWSAEYLLLSNTARSQRGRIVVALATTILPRC